MLFGYELVVEEVSLDVADTVGNKFSGVVDGELELGCHLLDVDVALHLQLLVEDLDQGVQVLRTHQLIINSSKSIPVGY